MTHIQEEKTEVKTTFAELGLSYEALQILENLKFKIPTPIQHKSIPIGLDGKDVIGIAQTGTGKTLAFALPIIEHILKSGGHGLVVLPTRELALQVDEVFKKMGQPRGIRTAVLIGGASMFLQKQSIQKNPHVVIGTPGRIIDHLEQKSIRFDNVKYLVLDEADRMLDMGFAPQMKRILVTLPKERQTFLFSATMPDDIAKIATTYMKLPVRVEVARAGTATERVSQELFIIRKEDKERLLEKILTEYRGTVLIFVKTKHGAKRIRRSIYTMHHTVAEIHSNRSLLQRREALDGFKTGKYRILVATDIAARGIDVTGIELVLNYDLPQGAEDYVHRIGRTGRAGQTGHAISFVAPEEKGKVRQIERLVRAVLKVSSLPELPPHRPKPFVAPDKFERPRRPQRPAPRPARNPYPSTSRSPRQGSWRGRR